MFRRSFHFLKALPFLLGIFASANLSASNGEVTTGSLVLEDLKNTSEWNAETTGFSGNFSKQVNAKEGDPVIPSQASASPTLGQEEGDSDNGMTRSAISAGEITLRNGGDLSGIHRDTANANAGSLSMDAIPNLSETLAQQADRSAVAAQASAVVAQTVGDVSDAMSNGSLVENGFEEGGLYRAGLHGLSQGIVAGLGGGNAAAAGAGAAASSYFAPTFHTGNEETDKLLGNLVSGGLGFAIGGNSGAFASSSVDANNRQLHPDERKRIAAAAKDFAAKHGITEAEANEILQKTAEVHYDPRHADGEGMDASPRSAAERDAWTYLQTQLGFYNPSDQEYNNWYYGWNAQEIQAQLDTFKTPVTQFDGASVYIFKDLLITREILPQLIWESMTPAEQQKSIEERDAHQQFLDSNKPLHDMTEEFMIAADAPMIAFSLGRGALTLGKAGVSLGKGAVSLGRGGWETLTAAVMKDIADGSLAGQLARNRVDASAPVGRIGGVIKTGDSANVGIIGGEMIVKPGTNLPTIIGGRNYSGHALDQMQGRGFVPSVVENTIQRGVTYSTRAGTTGYYDAVNDVRVIVNTQSGRVVTVIPGKP